MKDKLTAKSGKKRENIILSELNKWNKHIGKKNRRLKFCKMASAPLVFFRGTNHLFWADFANHKDLQKFGNEKTKTWIQGDLHAYNFGSFGNSQGKIVYDFNDFDETIFADYQFDLWRMAISIVLVAYQNKDLSLTQQEKVIDTYSQTYLDTMSMLRKEKIQAPKYTSKENTFGKLNHFLESVEDQYSREEMLNKWSPFFQDSRQFDLERDKLGKIKDDKECQAIRDAMPSYRKSLGNALGKNDDYFRVIDIAYRLLAGTGSLGTNRYYVLIAGDEKGNRILDVKHQSKPTAYKFLGSSFRKEYDTEYESDAARHAIGYKALTECTDKHLGQMYLDVDIKNFQSGSYSVRERSPFKEAFPGEVLDTRFSFSAMAEQWAEIIAFNHARAKPKLPKSINKLTKDREEKFLSTIRKIAFKYTEQVLEDWDYFVDALDLDSNECQEQPFSPPTYRNMLPR